MRKILLTVIVQILFLSAHAQWATKGNNSYIDKNVGIGTDTPQYRLDVNGDINATSLHLGTANLINNWSVSYIYYPGESLVFKPKIDDKNTEYEFLSGTSSYRSVTSQISLHWSPSKGVYKKNVVINTKGISFFNGGNVGIGTENPQYKLDVNGDMSVQNIVIKPNYKITPYLSENFTYQNKTVGHYSLQWANDSWNDSGQSLYLTSWGGIKFFANGKYRMGITDQGNVGIGTENPQYKLEVNGDINATSLHLGTANLINNWNVSYIYYPGESLVFKPKIDDKNTEYEFLSGTSSYRSVPSQISLQWSPSKDVYEKSVVINTRGNSFFNGGNVGIGTDKPKYKLEVVGIIRAEEIKIEAQPWADFVFDKDYKLPSLDEVKAHIDEHKHLPNIPSEKEVQENGIGLGEMQAKLLQKIEELTLYVIQQNKTIEKQGQRILELERKK